MSYIESDYIESNYIGSRWWLCRMTTTTTSVNKHISIPKTFSSGDVDEWFCRFEICSKANDWNAATQAAKLPTLLERSTGSVAQT